MYSTLFHNGSRLLMTHDGRLLGLDQPEPEFMLRRYAHATALRDMRRDDRLRQARAEEPRGFVERIRVALGIA
jgi:hypothetical protein